VNTHFFKTLVLAVLAVSVSAGAAEPDRQSLIDAWVEFMPSAPGTTAFEVRGDGVYYLEDENLPYAGEVRLVSALVRPAEATAEGVPFTHMGVVEFKLADLPVERLQTQNYYYWLADRQTLHFSEADEAWVGPAAYRTAIQSFYSRDESFGPLSFMLNYGIWIFLVALLIWVFSLLNRHNRKARSLMDDSASINEKARENLERSEKMQKEAIEISRALLDIQKANSKLLEQIRDRLGS